MLNCAVVRYLHKKLNIIKSHFDLSVLIPCYNNQAGLIRSLQSLSYASGRYCIVIVDDGSTEAIQEAGITPFIPDYAKVFILRLDQNQGITVALNTGLRWIKERNLSPYIARLDCSDTCHKDRFTKQVAFMKEHPEVGLLGSWCTFQLPDGSGRFIYKTPTYHEAIMQEMYFRNVFIHPTVMLRTAIIDRVGYYPENYIHVEDYAYFWAIAERTKTAILPEYLVTCEINYKGISLQNRHDQLKGRYTIISDFGTKYILKVLGQIKLKILMKVPNTLIVKLKERRS
jgi:glycosyltransferase involved in cell wall biosynthesis